ncbi:probable 2-methylcitrate dehydratase protein [Rhizobium etli CFN 42]|uniref:Probable 2-methylcitrate dehydratase protein n=1 Tax=Rhizobium etli (strain ATCC 51251 / DSM 11541 / JCM 21823 / NBRC 15573 / CFN 42) TaxID=347834 RepID=Q2K8S0_RHIEC|nr:MmgE/PrpD family protein [Rhizobium etli]ABC90766.1 probable 2-methylcitrate dehydratase protein [Rhizobium etli CFN 42]
MAHSTLCYELVHQARQRVSRLQNASSRQRALNSIIDAVGCMFIGAASATKPFGLTEPSNNGIAVVIGRSTRAGPSHAALLNGYHAHFLDFDDSLYPAQSHPTAVILPALLAAVSIKEVDAGVFFDALAVGFEFQGLLGELCAQRFYDDGWWTTALLGAPAAALAVAHVLGYTAEVSAHATALAIASSFGMKGCFGSSAKALGVGLSARAGFEAALLAQSGHTGPLGILEDARGPLALRNVNVASGPDYGRDSLFLDAPGPTYKLYPVCTAAHATIDALRQIREDGVTPEEVENITVRVNKYVVSCLTFARPNNREEAQFSLPFSVASVMARGTVGLAELDGDFINSEQLRRWFSKISIVEDPSVGIGSTSEGSGQEAAVVEVYTPRGRHEKRVDHAKGQTLNPLSPQDLEEKYLSLVSAAFSSDVAKDTLTTLKCLIDSTNVEKTLGTLVV